MPEASHHWRLLSGARGRNRYLRWRRLLEPCLVLKKVSFFRMLGSWVCHPSNLNTIPFPGWAEEVEILDCLVENLHVFSLSPWRGVYILVYCIAMESIFEIWFLFSSLEEAHIYYVMDGEFGTPKNFSSWWGNGWGWIGMESFFWHMDVYWKCLSFVNWIESHTHTFFMKWTSKELQWFWYLKSLPPLSYQPSLMIHGGQALDGSTGEAWGTQKVHWKWLQQSCGETNRYY